MRRRRIAEPTVRQELEFVEAQYAALAAAKAERLERARVTRIQNMLQSGKDIEENGAVLVHEMRYTYLENKWLNRLGECADEVALDPMATTGGEPFSSSVPLPRSADTDANTT